MNFNLIKVPNCLSSFLILFIISCSSYGASIDGTWATFDEDSTEVRANIELKVSNGKLNGYVQKIFYKKGEQEVKICFYCDGVAFNKPFNGLHFLYNLKSTDNVNWHSGEILNLYNGKLYKCKLKLNQNGKTIHLTMIRWWGLSTHELIWKRVS